MAVDKDFVIKNGLEVNEDLLYADTDTDRVGIGITTPSVKLDVVGDTSVSGIASVGIALSTHDAKMTGFTTSFEGLHVGSGGTVLSANTLNKKVGINSATPQYTTDIIGTVSTGNTALYVFGDVEVTGNIKGTELLGQITDGGSVGFSTLTVSRKLEAPLPESYHVFNVESVGGTQWKYLSGGSEPIGIGFTEDTINPTIFLNRGQNYRFNVNASGNPFYIKLDKEANTSNQYIDGVENNGAQVGIITFKVPYNAPPELFYQASNQGGMNGEIKVVGVFTGGTEDLLVTGVATINQANLEYLNVTGFSTLGGEGASVTQIEVTGVSTLPIIKTGGIDVGSGIITASNLNGAATNAENVNIDERNNDQEYQVGFVTANTTTYGRLLIDTDDAQFTYNPQDHTLTVGEVAGNLNGESRDAYNVQVDERNNNQEYQVGFVTANGNTFQRVLIDEDNAQLTYNPSTHSLTAGTFIGSLNGTALNATNINTQNDNTDASQFPVFVSDAADGTNNRPRVDSQFTYNPDTNVLTAGGFVGQGTTITELNASELSTGTVPGDRGVTAGSADSSFVEYNGTTKTAGQFDGGTTTPDSTIRLNYDGQLHATGFTGPLTGNASSASQIKTRNSNDNQNFNITFVDGNNSSATNESLKTDGQLLYNPSTDLLTVSGGSVSASGENNNFGNTTIDDLEADSLNVTDTTASTSKSTGAIKCLGGVGIAGALNVGGDITAFASSDERLKDNIEPIPNALLKMKKISGNTFDWNEESSRSGSECGVIAQEIESLGLPGLVTTREDGYKAVRYEKLVPLLIEAIKELTERVQELEK